MNKQLSFYLQVHHFIWQSLKITICWGLTSRQNIQAVRSYGSPFPTGCFSFVPFSACCLFFFPLGKSFQEILDVGINFIVVKTYFSKDETANKDPPKCFQAGSGNVFQLPSREIICGLQPSSLFTERKQSVGKALLQFC